MSGKLFKEGVNLFPQIELSAAEMARKRARKEREKEHFESLFEKEGPILEILKKRHKEGKL